MQRLRSDGIQVGSIREEGEHFVKTHFQSDASLSDLTERQATAVTKSIQALFDKLLSGQGQEQENQTSEEEEKEEELVEEKEGDEGLQASRQDRKKKRKEARERATQL